MTMNIVDINVYKTNNKDIQRGKKMSSFVDILRKRGYKSDEEIIGRANDVLQEYHVDFKDGMVPIIKILNHMGIKVYENEMDIKAYITVNAKYADSFGTTKFACVKKDIPYGFKRFALAHELAHYIFDYNDSEMPEYYNTYSSSDDDAQERIEERRANLFARNLLMPKEIFIKKHKEFKQSTNSIPDTQAELAKFFGVEVRAITKRFEELGISNI